MENRHIFSVDTTDNVGSEIYYKSTKFISSSSLKGDIHDNDTTKTAKSFIQQRVERLYGPGALAQGFYSPKKTKSQEISILSERSSNSQIKYSSTKTVTSFDRELTSSSTTINGKTTVTSSPSLERTTNEQSGNENCENIQNSVGNFDLPVLRHLRPEFRAQLPIMSPKRSPNKFPVSESNSCPVLQNGNSAAHFNGATNGNESYDVNGKIGSSDKQSTGKLITIHFVSDIDKLKKPASYTNGNVNNTINSCKFDSSVIAPELTKSIPCDKSSTDMKLIEICTQESNVCDKSLATEIISSILSSEKKLEGELKVMTNEVSELSPDNIVGHDTTDRSAAPLPTEIAPPLQIEIHSKVSSSSSKQDEEIRDGNYFLKILKTEQDRLLQLADQTEKELETLLASPGASEDVLGYLRSASGKGRLLVSQKMKQFEGLCKNNLNQLPGEKFPTTNEDLQGFWDMVLLQVAHIDSLFSEIEALKNNNWQKPTPEAPSAPQGSKLTRRPIPSKIPSATPNGTANTKKSSAASLAAQRREAQRKQLMEIKRKNKLAMSSTEQQLPSQNQVVEIFVNDQANS